MGIGTPSYPPQSADEWNNGSCDIMAVALHRMYGFALMAEFEWGYDNGMEALGFLSHAWTRLPDGRDLDAAGIQDQFTAIGMADEDDLWASPSALTGKPRKLC